MLPVGRKAKTQKSEQLLLVLPTTATSITITNTRNPVKVLDEESVCLFELMNESDFSALCVTLLLFAVSFFRTGVISLTSNIVVLLMFVKFKELRTATNFIIINLAFTDIGVAGIGYPMSAASDIHGSWKFGHTGCQVSGTTLQRLLCCH